MIPTTCIPDPYTSSSVCLAPPSSDTNPDVTATTVQPDTPDGLAFTGGDVLGFGIIGAVALIGGAVVVAANHRRSRWNVPRTEAERNPWRVS